MELGRDSDTGGQVRASSHLSLLVRVHNADLKGFSDTCSTHYRFLAIRLINFYRDCSTHRCCFTASCLRWLT